ncbi:MAG: HAMP domain-containing sensor histidine kinase [Ignavibacteria bacterium]
MMQKRSLFTKLYLPYIVLIPAILLVFGIVLSHSFKSFYLDQTANELTRVASIIKDEVTHRNIDSLQYNSTFSNYENLTGIRITLVKYDGKVIADSKANSSSMDNHGDREEIKEAKTGKRGISVRKSPTLDVEFMYVALPIFDEQGKVQLIIRVSATIEHLNTEFRTINFKITIFLIFLYLAILISGYIFSKRIVKPLEKIETGAEKFSKGDFSEKIYSTDIKEYSILSEYLNKMAEQINENMEIILQQNNLRNSILESMKEGVVAVDDNMKIIFINSEASKILEIENDSAKGKIVQEVIRIYEIHKFIEEVLKSNESLEKNIIIQKEKDINLQLTGAILESSDGKPMGVIMVINDITNIFTLDTMKKDFVANVSHELKTPITSIKGFLETLLSGSIDDKENAVKFLNIISKNTDRLNDIIDDLLLLSKVEQIKDARYLKFEDKNVSEIIKTAVENLSHKAEIKGIRLNLVCDEGLIFPLNSNLIEQAIINLIDNSIKYCANNSEINVSAVIFEKALNITVADNGIGIPKEDIPRLFERFYRVDKARTREEGGTGLGLSIVKHICFVHNGTVEVESEVNKGSKFIIKIPQKSTP